MKKILEGSRDEKVITLASNIVYAQRQEWCEAKYRQLKMSLMKPRYHYPYDEDKTYPLIVWICGGSFIEVDCNVWMPEMVYFAKHGYAVASVEYSVTSLTEFPDQLIDIKEAIRFLRAHAEQFCIDPDKIAVMGESAGGYFSALIGMTGDAKEYDKGEYLQYSSAVQAAILWYPLVNTKERQIDRKITHCPENIINYPNLCDLVRSDLPPYLILHGLEDTLVSYRQGETLYNALQAVNVPSDLYLIQGANHADHSFIQTDKKELILGFINEALYGENEKT